ncbi:hypothetical protein ACWKSP_06115 [Micromonosporaceae bacterium Da 78-11]
MAEDPAVIDYLRQFYVLQEQTPSGRDDGGWTIRAEVGAPHQSMQLNQWGVGHRADPSTRTLWLRADDSANLAITTRKCVREVLVDYCEQRHYVMLHASAVADDRTTIVIVGDKGSGKTTLALKATINHQMRYLSNDHLILYAADDSDPGPGAIANRLVVTSLPTLIPVKIGTYLDMEPFLPTAWSVEDLDVDAYRDVPREQLYGLDQRVLYTYRTLGQDSPATVSLGGAVTGPAAVVVLARYAEDTAAPAAPVTPVDDPLAALMPHIRTDWMFDRNLNQQYLPRGERTPAEYLADAERLVRALADRARTVEWRHHGDPSGLLGRAQVEKSS